MNRKTLFSFVILSLLFIENNSFANSQQYRDEIPSPEKLSDFTIGFKRIEKGLKYEAKGKIKKANKMYEESINFLLEANKNRNSDPNIFFYLGFAYNKLRNIENAEIYYTLGLTLDPKNPYINLNLGELYFTSKRKNLAKERLKALSMCNCDQYSILKNIIQNN